MKPCNSTVAYPNPEIVEDTQFRRFAYSTGHTLEIRSIHQKAMMQTNYMRFRDPAGGAQDSRCDSPARSLSTTEPGIGCPKTFHHVGHSKDRHSLDLMNMPAEARTNKKARFFYTDFILRGLPRRITPVSQMHPPAQFQP